eukprot:366462-Chlamydomonas_euryale.AAC.19
MSAPLRGLLHAHLVFARRACRVALQYVERYGFDAVRILKVPKNQGKGHAVRRGMGCARGEVLLLMDADGATRVRDLELLEATLTKVQRPPAVSDAVAAGAGPAAGMGVVYGSRSHLEKAAMARRSRLRNVLTWGFHLCVMIVAGGRIRDTQCGFKLFTRPAAALLFGNQRLQRWCFDVELLYLAEQLDVPVAEVPVSWTEMPGSKIRPTSILHMAYELLTIKAAYQWFGLWKIYCTSELEFLAAQHAARLAGADKAHHLGSTEVAAMHVLDSACARPPLDMIDTGHRQGSLPDNTG